MLLPTRNGGEQIRGSIVSVLGQAYSDMELVVVDNASTDDTQAIVQSFGADSRLKYIRQEQWVNVTENWKRALDASIGDYFVMIGDDDCLLPNYFNRLVSAIQEHRYPDCISYDGYLYLFPTALQRVNASYFSDSHYNLFNAAPNDSLSAAARRTIVRDTFRYRSHFLLNMQTNLIAREAAERLPGGIFRGPFPDFYALNAMLLQARTFTCLAEKLVVVGLSPKSFGHYYYDQRQSEGMTYLGSMTSYKGSLPGDELLNSKHATLLELRTTFAIQLGRIKPDRRGYVLRQVLAWYREKRRGNISMQVLARRLAMLTVWDWLRLASSLLDSTTWSFVRRRMADRPASTEDEVVLGGVHLRRFANARDILEFASAVSLSRQRSAGAE